MVPGPGQAVVVPDQIGRTALLGFGEPRPVRRQKVNRKKRKAKTEPRRCLLCNEIIPAADLYFFPMMAWCWECQEAGKEEGGDGP